MISLFFLIFGQLAYQRIQTNIYCFFKCVANFLRENSPVEAKPLMDAFIHGGFGLYDL